MRKFDSTGKFIRFRGFTIVSAVQPSDIEVWGQFFSAISESPLLQAYFSPLPPESYHMTTTMLENEVPEVDCEAFFIPRLPLYGNLKKLIDIEQGSLFPVFKVGSVSSEFGIFLCGTIDEEHKKVIKEFAERHQLTHMLPGGFHITLAYQYRHIHPDLRSEIMSEVAKRLNECLDKMSTFSLQNPRLCYYHDMTKFIPWDGEGYPFDK